MFHRPYRVGARGVSFAPSKVALDLRPSDLERILALPIRLPVPCERVNGKWSPEAQALVEVVTARYARPPRATCACRSRTVEVLRGGRILVFHQGAPGKTPPPPWETTLDVFRREDPEAGEKVAVLRAGQLVLEGLGRPCITSLKPLQAWILNELPRVGGVLGYLPIGSGKTICGLLAPLAMPHTKTVALLAKSDQRLHYRNHYLHLREHFKVPSIVFDDTQSGFIVPGTPVLHFVSYSVLQQPSKSELLENLRPEFIIADEAHCLAAAPSFRRRGSTRTTRFLRYMAKHGNIHFCAWSGSLINKSLCDVTHLSAHALGLGSPYPIKQDDVAAWSAVVDPSYDPDRTSSTAKALHKAFGSREKSILIEAGLESDEKIRTNLRQRAIHTAGVVSSTSSLITTSISMHRRDPGPLPQAVRDALKGVTEDWQRPDGEELVEVTEKYACAREVGAGFYYRWVYPHAKDEHLLPGGLIEQWFAARKAWNKELRVKLMYGEPFMDSPSLCENAAKRFWADLPPNDKLPRWAAEAWPAWRDVKDLVAPVTKAVWIDDYLVKDAIAWGKEHVGIIWYESRAFGMKVAQAGDFPFHAGGVGAEGRILAERGDRSIVASISSHSEGRDGLQFHFSKQLVAEVPASGKAWDQLLGRTAREGQTAETVETWVYANTEETRDAMRKAYMLAAFDEAMSPNASLLLAADADFSV
jgi:hypothetical protein